MTRKHQAWNSEARSELHDGTASECRRPPCALYEQDDPEEEVNE